MYVIGINIIFHIFPFQINRSCEWKALLKHFSDFIFVFRANITFRCLSDFPNSHPHKLQHKYVHLNPRGYRYDMIWCFRFRDCDLIIQAFGFLGNEIFVFKYLSRTVGGIYERGKYLRGPTAISHLIHYWDTIAVVWQSPSWQRCGKMKRRLFRGW